MSSVVVHQASAQTNQWAWMGGSNTVNHVGVYGTLGTPAAGNIPGSRQYAKTWTDGSGHLWLFGGYGDANGTYGYLNDLWEFNPSTNQWAWMGGSSTPSQFGVYGTLGTPAAGNIPGGREYAVSWIDHSGHLWLFGGSGYGASGTVGYLNDLWEFNPFTNQWAWMGGSSSVGGHDGVYGALGAPATGNSPGSREWATGWTDSSGDLWLFGGQGYDTNGSSGDLNDLWEFNPSTNQWAWIGGSNTVNHAGTYGTLGIPAAGNVPGGRLYASSWTDTSGNLWLFGGQGYNTSCCGDLNDLWEFNSVTNQWTWMGGSSTAPQSGVYGTLGASAPGNVPGSRYEASSWTDGSGNLWLFGGYGYGANGTLGYLNDLWVLSPSTNLWTWMGGSSTVASSGGGRPGLYGTLGTPAAGNIPGGRNQASSWTDSSGHLWLFGGYGYDTNDSEGYVNDLWEYQPPSQLPIATPKVTVTPSLTSLAPTQALTVTVVVGEFGSVTPTGSVVLTSSSYTSPSTTLVGGSATFNFAAGSLAVGSYTFTASYTPDSSSSATYIGATGTAATVTVALPVTATPVFSLPAGSYTSTQTVTISSATAGATIYYTTNGTTPTTSSTVYSGTAITVSSSETLEAIAVLSGYNYNAVAFAGYLISPLAVGGVMDWTWMGGSNIGNHVGVYGTLGSPASANIPGGRYDTTTWNDGSGHLWLFGGLGYASVSASYLNDLWEFNPSTGQWAWMGGSSAGNQIGVYGTLGTPAAGNVPGGRYGAVSWTDSSGHIWFFGGFGYGTGSTVGDLNDLWELNTSTNQWAWMGGSGTINQAGLYGTLGIAAAGNVPGSRQYAMSWTDNSGNFWLFGGRGYDSSGTIGYLNDLWEFNPSTNQWTWMGGSSAIGSSSGTGGHPGVYGTLGIPASANIPGSRYNGATWTDSSGHLWLFGGDGYGASFLVFLNDLWEFNPSTNQWAWMGGSTSSQTSVYGTVGIPAPGNTPGGRVHPSTWTDSSGHIWLFGGDGYSAGGSGYLNDLWVLNPSTNLWAWMGGTNTDNQPGVYGTLGMPAGTNVPGGRQEASSWTDSSGHLWLFGGEGYGANSLLGFLNDQWEYQPPSQLPLVAPKVTVTPSLTSITTLQALTFTVVVAEGIVSATPTGSVVLTGDGYTSPSTALVGGSATFNLAAGSLPVGSFTFTASYTPDSTSSPIYSSATGTSATVRVALPVAATPVFSVPGGSYISGQTVTISDGTAGATIYYTIDGTTPTTSSTVYGGGMITVSSSGNLEAIATLGGYTNSAIGSAGYLITPLAVGGALDWTWMGGSSAGNQIGVYGTLGTPAAGNIPGSRFGATSWTDGSGNFWLFGGEGSISGAFGFFDDLWEFNPSTSQWAWMAGSSTLLPCNSACGLPGVYGTLGTPAPGNNPGNRFYTASWTDSGGHLWLFGGSGYDASNISGSLNDLWIFNPSTNQWAWMGGSSTVGSASGRPGVYGTLGTPAAGNIPGGRATAVTWTDSSGHFWLFGGYGFDANGNNGYLNDLWEFNPSTNQWAWMSGSSTVVSNATGRPGVYGTLDTPAAGNNPGSREGPTSWTDSSGNLWLFGGYGYDVNGTLGDLNDLWEFNPSTNQWAWIGGSSTEPPCSSNYCGQTGVYGTLGMPAAGNIPGGRGFATGWTDSSGNFWLFGGGGFDANDTLASLNDLWVLNPSANQWAWMGGSSTGTHAGVYGTLGTPAAGNSPGGREWAVSWTGASGHLWLFGGIGSGFLNDLWEYQLPSSQLFTSQTITFAAPASPATYGVSPISLVATGGASGNPVVFSVVSGPGTVIGSTLTITGAGTVVVAANQAGNSSFWGAAQVTLSIVVNPATLTVGVAGTPVLIYGEPTPPLPYTIGPFVNGDTQASATTGAPTLATTAVPRSPAGTYPITVGLGTLAAANYVFTATNGTLNVVGGAAQSILFPPLANFSHGSVVTLVAVATSGLPVTFVVGGGPASISGSTLTITGTGPVVIFALQPGDSSFAAAPTVVQSFIAQ